MRKCPRNDQMAYLAPVSPAENPSSAVITLSHVPVAVVGESQHYVSTTPLR
jgi:hypothetical protein